MKLKRWKPQTKRLSRAAARACADAEALAYLETQRHYSAQTVETTRDAVKVTAHAIETARAELKSLTDELDKRRRTMAASARTLDEQRTHYAAAAQLHEAVAKRHGQATADVIRYTHARDTAEWHAIYSAALTEALAAECERRRRAAAAGEAPSGPAKATRQRRRASTRQRKSRRDA